MGGSGYRGVEVGPFLRGGIFEEVAQYDEAACEGYGAGPRWPTSRYSTAVTTRSTIGRIAAFLVEVLVQSPREPPGSR